MTERNQVHHIARKYLSPFGRLVRFENSLVAGTPDLYYLLRGVSGWLEEKMVEPSGILPKHLTLEQIMWGEAEVRNGGRWHLLARCGPAWWLMDARGCRSWYQGAPATPLIAITGRFPVKEILDIIAPLRPKDERYDHDAG